MSDVPLTKPTCEHCDVDGRCPTGWFTLDGCAVRALQKALFDPPPLQVPLGPDDA